MSTSDIHELHSLRTEIDIVKSRNSKRRHTKVVFPSIAESCFPPEETIPITPYKVLTFSVDLLACREWDAFCGRRGAKI